eukprot:766603-Hanusia_phi.AAC.5
MAPPGVAARTADAASLQRCQPGAVSDVHCLCTCTGNNGRCSRGHHRKGTGMRKSLTGEDEWVEQKLTSTSKLRVR